MKYQIFSLLSKGFSNLISNYLLYSGKTFNYYNKLKESINKYYISVLATLLDGHVSYLGIYRDKRYCVIYRPRELFSGYLTGDLMRNEFLSMLNHNEYTYLAHKYDNGFKKELYIPGTKTDQEVKLREIGYAMYNNIINIEECCKEFQNVLSQNEKLTTIDFLYIIKDYYNLPIDLNDENHEIRILWCDTFDEQIFKGNDILRL